MKNQNEAGSLPNLGRNALLLDLQYSVHIRGAEAKTSHVTQSAELLSHSWILLLYVGLADVKFKICLKERDNYSVALPLAHWWG